MVLAVLMGAIGIALMCWPRLFLVIPGMYRSGSVLSIGARTRTPPFGLMAVRVARVVGLFLLGLGTLVALAAR